MLKIFEDIKEQTKDFVLHMLGAPTVKIEMCDEQLEFCLMHVGNMMSSSSKILNCPDSLKVIFYQDGVLAHAKLILGRIRSKFQSLPKGVNSIEDGTADSLFLDGTILLNEGHDEYDHWRRNVL